MSNQIHLEDVLPTMEQALTAVSLTTGLPLFGPSEHNGRWLIFGFYVENGESKTAPHLDANGRIKSFPRSRLAAARRYCDRLNRAVAARAPVLTCVIGSAAWQTMMCL